jgi:hypothetical protein
MAKSYPLIDTPMSLTRLERPRCCPPRVVIVCAACGDSGQVYYVPMLTHKQLASAGLIWCPQCYEGRKGRRYTSGHLGDNLRPQKGRASLPLQKPGGNASSFGSLSSTTCDGTTFASFPTLWEFLTLSTWPDATSRLPGTMILFVEGDKWKVCLKDPNGKRVCFVTGKDLDSVLLATDAGLDGNDLDWRPDRSNGQQRR